MIFSLEALNAKHGDCLILHFGTLEDPRYILIDGGPAGVFRSTLHPRLLQLASREPELALQFELILVSHLDDDHIRGIIELADDLLEQKLSRIPLDRYVVGIWHNSFDDIVGDSGRAAGPDGAGLQSIARSVRSDAAAVINSVPQARRLREQAKALAWQPNFPFRGLVTREGTGAREVDFEGGVSFLALGPDQARVAALQRDWDRALVAQGFDQPASPELLALVDDSIANLASIVVLARAGGRSMLLTGDARADDVMTALESAGLLSDAAPLHVDLLKMPHHGSVHNVDDAFFRRVTAENYVFSADGRFDNPDIETLQLLTEARGDAAYTLHFTNHDGANDLRKRLDSFFRSDRRRNDRRYRVRYRRTDRLSISVHLGPDRHY